MHITHFCKAVDRDHDGTTLSKEEMTSLLNLLSAATFNCQVDLVLLDVEQRESWVVGPDHGLGARAGRLATSDHISFEELKSGGQTQRRTGIAPSLRGAVPAAAAAYLF